MAYHLRQRTAFGTLGVAVGGLVFWVYAGAQASEVGERLLKSGLDSWLGGFQQ